MTNEDVIQRRIQRLVRDQVTAMQAYQVPSAEGMIKLDAMENPYGWPESLVEAWLESLRGAEVNRYPDPDPQQLKFNIRELMSVPEQFDILLGNGSDELIQLICLALAKPGAAVMVPEPGFSMYRILAQSLGMDYIGVPLNEDFNLDLSQMLDAVEVQDPAVIFLAQPNNPTGNLFGEEKIRRIVEAANGLVVIDEAYLAFTDSNLLPLLSDYDNLVLLRTLSKVGLAGLRLGMMMGSPLWLNEFNKIRLPYNINSLSQISANFALQHFKVLKAQTQVICEDRQRLYESMQSFEQLQLWPIEANFILFRPLQCTAGEVFERLKQAGLLIKNLHGSHPLLDQCLRVTVGRAEENDKFVEALRAALH